MTHSGQGPEQQYPAAQPLPPEVTPGGPSDAQATQYLPPVPPQAPPGPPAAYGYPQQPPAQPQPGYGYPGPDAQATQYIAPVPPQAPQAPHASQEQPTQYLPPVPPQQQAPGHAPQEAATQYMAPVPPAAPVPPTAPAPAPGERPPLADFDNLFRSETPNPAPAPAPGYGYPHPGAPQQHQQPPQQPYGYGQPPAPPQQPYGQQAYQDAYYEDEPAPRRKSPVALIAAVVIGCAVVGLGAGALLSGGDDDKKENAAGKGDQNVAASSAAPSAQASGEPADDPAKGQAEELDKLLADSNNSRDAVISAVASIRKCDNLDQAANDLRGAAKQRRELVTRLQGLTVDKIPDNAALSAALVKAWQASAAADDHYAAWADQAKGNKNVCKGGHARNTGQTNEGDKKSGEATAAKKQAAGLWNPTAAKYGLTKRTYTQL
ncbi:hypothetical protein [Streptomyces sp. NPDC053541]|uniref:hypothetical protein n=1 Tax=Streptomyces sp. NPDC053541 TaxID=3365709 RepID=UPI0037D94323